ncbi:alpha-ketoglutarate-dependent dioxygenase AlkB [Massilia sp. Leaf139]|uniref:alpha-ketoglutarate-dependent dioxygenase AlkB family protein n=1 Tax=Massilia sp. Leaf139 TaxID=1736272 RepID=UPI0006F29A11|nr:alpha-ketoglutarate-dependent dioxygenase AlkB [Massilia sp. Leaf139]KQQ88358.1 DNA repair protein [Massilia sp. Leaf139]
MDLFDTPGALTPIPIDDGELALLSRLPLPLSNAEVFERLLHETPWREESVIVFGKRHLQPRLTAWYGDASYTYSGLRLEPLPWTPLLMEIRAAVEAACGEAFNSVLLNRYRNGRDSMGMHSDNEPELGEEPAIASLSFGATRTFILKHKNNRQSLRLPLEDGSLLLMRGQLQRYWLHGINKSALPLGERINLTFRYVV